MDLGLAQSLVSGGNAALESFANAYSKKQDRDLQQQQVDALLAEKGLAKTTDANGNTTFGESPVAKALRQRQEKLGYEKDMFKPETDPLTGDVTSVSPDIETMRKVTGAKTSPIENALKGAELKSKQQDIQKNQTTQDATSNQKSALQDAIAKLQAKKGFFRDGDALEQAKSSLIALSGGDEKKAKALIDQLPGRFSSGNLEGIQSQLGLGGGSVASHPQDSQAIAWAKANPGPKADAILKANGVK